ncbi:MAG TPA: FtsW/RodA/SpoVE family cell cycle protein [Candidatus Paceibacterota bacterium]|nr:FtsW/RodA/SpoVE family cell cycle protein [Candidatus Paceibacterota bacterium]
MKARGDRVFFALVLLLAFAGLAIFSSAALGLLARQSSTITRDILDQISFGLAGGLAALFLLERLPLSFLKKWAPAFYGATLLLTALVFIPGVGVHSLGATRWINVGFTTVQPAEFLKIGVVLALAWWLARNARQLKDPRRGLAPFLALTGLPSILLLLQPNTSTTLLILATGMAMYFAAGAPWRDFGILIGLALLAGGLVFWAHPYTRARVMTFLHPSANSLGSGYQIQQSLLAVGSGGFLGKGFGQSVEKFNYLPEPDGDSVFAVFAEEWGFVGAVALVAVFVLLAGRGFAIAGASRDLFGALIALGFSVMIAVQAFINICAMLGIIPLTGLPLPFVSHGGTALLATLAMCGLILAVAAHRKAA